MFRIKLSKKEKDYVGTLTFIWVTKNKNIFYSLAEMSASCLKILKKYAWKKSK